jgi:hypothetical protein
MPALEERDASAEGGYLALLLLELQALLLDFFVGYSLSQTVISGCQCCLLAGLTKLVRAYRYCSAETTSCGWKDMMERNG